MHLPGGREDPKPYNIAASPPGQPDHDCVEVMEEAFSSRLDLTDQPLKYPDVEYFTDGSSFVKEGERLAGYSVVSLHSTIEAKALPKGTSTQRAELIALTQALQLEARIHVDIYINSKYVFTTSMYMGLYIRKGG